MEQKEQKVGWIRKQINDFKSIFLGDDKTHFFNPIVWAVALFIGGIGAIKYGMAHGMIMAFLALNLAGISVIYVMVRDMVDKIDKK